MKVQPTNKRTFFSPKYTIRLIERLRADRRRKETIEISISAYLKPEYNFISKQRDFYFTLFELKAQLLSTSTMNDFFRRSNLTFYLFYFTRYIV